MIFTSQIAKGLNLKQDHVNAVIELLEDGNTVPFIARYRKEQTGSMDEDQIRLIESELDRLKQLKERRDAILRSLKEQDKLTPELMTQIESAETLTLLEDIYLPYKPKRKTRASIAIERGLQGLADLIIKQPLNIESPEGAASKYLNEQVTTIEEALAGARDIVAGMISEHADVRRITRNKGLQSGVVRSDRILSGSDAKSVFEVYYEFECAVPKIHPHQVLALNRGEEEGVLSVRVFIPEKDWRIAVLSCFKADTRSSFFTHFNTAVEDCAERLLLPAIERDIRRSLTETAWKHAINVFGLNLKALLLNPPLSGHAVLGVDPGFRTGCKIAVVDVTGKLLDTATIYPHEPHNKLDAALAVLKNLITRHSVDLIAIGNGTASRESEQMAAKLIHELPGVKYLIVSEAGASVYSASPLAKSELPGLDVTLRGAVSIARRVQDPMAELVKIDPKSIGIGLYQHDVDQTELSKALDGVVEDVVNHVGVNLNTASPSLLAKVSGIGPKLAEKIVEYRNVNGKFTNRDQLMKVSGLGPKSFEQCAGFLRIMDGDNPLDMTAIHPESYAITGQLLKIAGINSNDLLDISKVTKPEIFDQPELLSREIGCGLPTLKDILLQIYKPGRDIRYDAPAPILRTDVLKAEDLIVGMKLKGTVRNVVDFGAFIDIGVKQDGLLHRTQIARGALLKVGDILDVEITKIEIERGRIGLKMANQN